MEFMPTFWLCVVILAFIIEAFTVNLVSIWFALGGTVSLIISLFTENISLQLFAFVLTAIIFLALTRPALKKLMNFKKEETNAGRCIGKTGLVIMEINNETGTGQVNVGGSVWTSRSFDNKIIPAGQNVKVEHIEGVKLIVSSLDD